MSFSRRLLLGAAGLLLAVPVPGSDGDRRAEALPVAGLPEKDGLHFILDIRAMAAASLGPEWPELAPAERKEFTDLMHDVIELNYDRLIRSVRPRRVVMTAEEHPAEGVVVRRFSARAANDPADSVEFVLTFKVSSAEWLLQDFASEGVSYVKAYRSQFLKILRNEGYAALAEKMRAHIAKRRAELGPER